MLTVPTLGRRFLVTPWSIGRTFGARYSNRDGSAQQRTVKRKEGAGKSRVGNGTRKAQDTEEPRQPSLIEQLFPEETKRYEEAQRAASREIPRLPLDTAVHFTERRDVEPAAEREASQSRSNWALGELMRREDQQSKQTTVLVLRNASPNLMEEDFRRLIPQGKHMEGWTLEQGDILKIIPGRDLATLEHKNYYYLLFSSRLSAFTYQGQATRMFRMATAHTPASMTSVLPPPPGYMIDGMDAHAAIEAFAPIPASQNLELRQLRPPLSPLLQSIVREQGYASLVKREDKMPFEVRLTLDGPQLQASTIRYILLASGTDRGLSWSGGDETTPHVTKWEPRAAPSPMEPIRQQAKKIPRERTEVDQMQRDVEKLQGTPGIEVASNGQAQQKRRTPQLVYIVGFHTQNAAQSFISYWHRRPLAWQGVDTGKDYEDDLPPVANVEMLW